MLHHWGGEVVFDMEIYKHPCKLNLDILLFENLTARLRNTSCLFGFLWLRNSFNDGPKELNTTAHQMIGSTAVWTRAFNVEGAEVIQTKFQFP